MISLEQYQTRSLVGFDKLLSLLKQKTSKNGKDIQDVYMFNSELECYIKVSKTHLIKMIQLTITEGVENPNIDICVEIGIVTKILLG